MSSLPLSVMVSSCHVCIVFVPRASRRCCALAVAPHRHNSGLGTKTTPGSWTFGLHEIFKCAHLKFMVYGRKQTYTQLPHMPVTLVWGSLRLTPIKLANDLSQTAWAIIRSSKACTKPHTLGHETCDKIFQALSLIFWGGTWVRGWGCCSYWSNAVLASFPGLPLFFWFVFSK